MVLLCLSALCPPRGCMYVDSESYHIALFICLSLQQACELYERESFALFISKS